MALLGLVEGPGRWVLDVGVHAASLLASTFQGLWESKLLLAEVRTGLGKASSQPFLVPLCAACAQGHREHRSPAGQVAHEPQVPFLRVL